VAQYEDKLFAVLVSWLNFLDPKISGACGVWCRFKDPQNGQYVLSGLFDRIDRPVLGTIVSYIYNLLLFCVVEMLLKCKIFNIITCRPTTKLPVHPNADAQYLRTSII
jgi:hypothetical protein